MSGYNAFLSFANYLRETLAGEITVIIEKREDEPVTYPYLLLQDGPDSVEKWLSSRMIQGWVVVQKEDDKPLVETLGRAVDKLVDVSHDLGQLTKFNYSTTPATECGTLIPALTQISDVMPRGSDNKISRKVVTWVLKSNHS